MRILITNQEEIYGSRRLKEEGRRRGHRVDAVRMRGLRIVARGEKSRVFLGAHDISEAYDVLYLRYYYPYFSEALLVAEWAKARGMLVIDRALADGYLVQSKMYEYCRLKEIGLPVPDGFQVMRLSDAKRELAGSKWPMIAKGVHGARGRYVFKMRDQSEFDRQVSEDLIGFFTFQDYLDIEQEYRVIVIGYKALGAMRKRGPKDDFRHNLAVGAEGEAARIPAAWLRMCEKAARALKREFAGIDLAIADGKPYILEVNRRPGFQGFEEATDLNVAGTFIDYVVKNRDRRSSERRKIHALPSHHQEAS